MTDNFNDFNTFEMYKDDIIEVDELGMKDIRINPDYYIHFGIIRAQSALSNPDIKQGFLQYRLFVEHIEVLCTAAKILSADYEADLKQYKDSEDFKKETDSLTRGALLANKKLELLMKEVFSSKTIKAPMKL
jgi:hypothetical protein